MQETEGRYIKNTEINKYKKCQGASKKIHKPIHGGGKMKYEVIIQWSKEDDCYLAEVPELPGCMADGENLVEVTAAIEESAKLWLEDNAKRGMEPPEPKGRLMYA